MNKLYNMITFLPKIVRARSVTKMLSALGEKGEGKTKPAPELFGGYFDVFSSPPPLFVAGLHCRVYVWQDVPKLSCIRSQAACKTKLLNSFARLLFWDFLLHVSALY